MAVHLRLAEMWHKVSRYVKDAKNKYFFDRKNSRIFVSICRIEQNHRKNTI